MPQIHGDQCLRCTASTVRHISARQSCCTAVRDAKKYSLLKCQVGEPGWMTRPYTMKAHWRHLLESQPTHVPVRWSYTCCSMLHCTHAVSRS